MQSMAETTSTASIGKVKDPNITDIARVMAMRKAVAVSIIAAAKPTRGPTPAT